MAEPTRPLREATESEIDVMTESDLDLVSGGYIGETEKNTKQV